MIIKREEKIKRTKEAKIVFIIAFAILAAYASVIIFILGWAFIQSLKAPREFVRDMISFPKQWLFSNYVEAFQQVQHNRLGFMGLLFNSIWFSFGLSFLSTFMCCVTGYIFARYKFAGKQIAFSFVLLTLSIPIVGNLPSLYKVIITLRLNESMLFLVTGLGGFSGNFLITYAFFKNMSSAYSEAAEIDGAGHFQIFIQIMIPLIKGPLTAIFLLLFIAHWNNYEMPILFLNTMPTLASGLFFYRDVALFEHNQPVYLAGVLISTIPILILVIVFGNKITKNMSVGGVKG